MNRVLNWSELAEQDIEETLDYLENKWGVSVACDFLDRLSASLLAVQSNPATYLEIDKKRHIHKFFLNKHITLYYQLTEHTIELITFWSNRKDDFELRHLLT
ncbi:MAG: type II toxin-antitoxin system RelE/ParE family toxin [Cyclobacteriaceae bacterium]